MKPELRDMIALSLVDGLGPRGTMALLGKAERTADVFGMSEESIACLAGRNFKGIGKISSIRGSKELADELSYMETHGIKAVSVKDEDYPAGLADIYDPPSVIYFKGDIVPEDANAVAIVGSRKCTAYGLQMAERLAFDLASMGITIVSGMAIGIDTAAHRGALKARGRTIAVMGSGFKHIYPPGSEALVKAISASGAIMTEHASDAEPTKGSFPRRNRIISGLSKGVIVVEASVKSGAMITVDFALEQGKEVFAVPGRADSYFSAGTNRLIQQGAKLVMNAEDVTEELRLGKVALLSRERVHDVPEPKSGSPLSAEEEKIAGDLGAGPLHIDTISELAGCDGRRVHTVLLGMEIKGLIKPLPGGFYEISGMSVG